MIRRSPRPRTSFTVIQNKIIEDPRISFKATAVLIYLLSKPDNWKCSTAHLAKVKRAGGIGKRGGEGPDAIRSALTELEQAGYIERRRYQDSAGRWAYETVVYDTPAGAFTHSETGDNHGDNQ